MGSATWRFEQAVDGELEDVWAWMTDLSKDDHNTEAFRRGAGLPPPSPGKPSARTVLSRDANVFRIRDAHAGKTYDQTVTVEPASHSVRIQGTMGYEATWRASEVEGHSLRFTGAPPLVVRGRLRVSANLGRVIFPEAHIGRYVTKPNLTTASVAASRLLDEEQGAGTKLG